MKITYADKENGSQFTPEDANMIKGVVNTNAEPPILAAIPETDASKAGQTFRYKSVTWEFMTAEAIADIGWDVPVGFPAPVEKVYNPDVFYGGDNLRFVYSAASMSRAPQGATVINILGIGQAHRVGLIENFGGSVELILNANLLVKLKNGSGTAIALNLSGNNMSEGALNDLFTQLPITEETATIGVKNNPGSATCDPTIATAKGYTVVTE